DAGSGGGDAVAVDEEQQVVAGWGDGAVGGCGRGHGGRGGAGDGAADGALVVVEAVGHRTGAHQDDLGDGGGDRGLDGELSAVADGGRGGGDGRAGCEEVRGQVAFVRGGVAVRVARVAADDDAAVGGQERGGGVAA